MRDTFARWPLEKTRRGREAVEIQPKRLDIRNPFPCCRRLSYLDRDRVGITYGLLCGIATGVGTLGYFAALRNQNASVVTPLTGVFPVLTVILASVILRERLNKLQMAGMLLALASIVILSI